MPHDPLFDITTYNPKAIARYYRWRVFTVWARALTVLLKFSWFGWGILWDRWSGQTEANIAQRANQIRKSLVDLGPSFIKVGQSLSTRPDLVRRDYLEELTKLQDQLPGFPSDQAMAKIERELELPVDTLFAEISSEPVAAASLGQVYKARLHSGEWVAVKVQRPQLEQRLSLDLHLIRWASTWIGPFLPLNIGRSLTQIVDEFGTKIYEEIDYLNEGRNAECFADYFLNDPDVHIPKIYWAFSSKRVLTLEWIDGIKLTDAKRVKEANLDTQKLIRTGVVSFLRQLLEYGFFHADPHPGNLFALRDGRMAFIDFGMMDQLSAEMKEYLVDALVHLVDRDYHGLVEDFQHLSFLIEEVDTNALIPALEKVLDNVLLKDVTEFNFKTATDNFSDLMYQYPFQVPPNFALVIRSLVTLEGVALSLDSNFQIVAVAYPYVAKRLLTDESPRLRARLTQVLVKDGKFYWNRLENLLEIAKIDGDLNLVPTARMGIRYLASEEAEDLRRQVILALTENERLQVPRIRRLWELVEGDFTAEQLWNLAIVTASETLPAAIPESVTEGWDQLKADVERYLHNASELSLPLVGSLNQLLPPR